MGKASSFDVNRALSDIKKDNKLAVVVAGFAATLVGLFLPWYSANVFGVRITSSPGLNSTGLLIAIAAVVGAGAILNVLDKDLKQMRTVSLVAAGLAALIVLTNYPNNELGSLVSVSIGYWLCAAGSIAAFAGILLRK